ncbi:MAG: hypothetical protein QW566_08200, partial [Candidatus Jordarchaeales archaeon]
MTETPLIKKAIEIGLKLGWDAKPAKKDKRTSLLSHTINVMMIADKLLEAYKHFNIYDVSEKKKIILSALFIHDFSKADEDISKQFLEGKVKDLPKRLRDKGKVRQEVEECLKQLGLDNSEINEAVDYAVSMEYSGPSDLDEFLSSKPVNKKIERILRLSDKIASIRTLDEALKFADLVEPLKLTYHKVFVIRGFSTHLLHKALQKIFRENGWFPVISKPEGTLYIGKNDFELNKEKLLSYLNDEFKHFIESFSETDIGEAAFGSFTATPIKTPEFVFMSRETAESFWT